MKRLRHWIFDIAAVMSMVMCAGIAVLWVCSFFVWPRVDYSNNDSRSGIFTGWVVYSFMGRIGVFRTRVWQKQPSGPDETEWVWYTVPQFPCRCESA